MTHALSNSKYQFLVNDLYNFSNFDLNSIDTSHSSVQYRQKIIKVLGAVTNIVQIKARICR